MEPCGLCDRALQQGPPFKGSRADLTKFMFVLHKPDSRIEGSLFGDEVSYDMALGGCATGKELTLLLDYCDADIEDIYLTNFFKCTLPKDADPRVGEYANCITQLEKQIFEFNPKRIVFFSKAIKKYIPEIENPHLMMAHPSSIQKLLNISLREAEYERVRSFLYD